jgi:hypothetical protein
LTVNNSIRKESGQVDIRITHLQHVTYSVYGVMDFPLKSPKEELKETHWIRIGAKVIEIDSKEDNVH